MSKSKRSVTRPGFREWVDGLEDPAWSLMPLTHVTKGINLEDILRANALTPSDCEVLNDDLSFFFYGRPAYRVSGDGSIKAEAACPTCLIFNSDLITKAEKVHAFDTGAFGKRMYNHILMEEMQVGDFSLEKDFSRPNKIISGVFKTKRTYFDADTTSALKSEEGAESWEFHTKAYLDLIHSPGRNEPDDRICTIEVTIKGEVSLSGNLMAAIVPHTLWNEAKQAPWLKQFSEVGVKIIPYLFVPNRHPEYYYGLMEGVVRKFYIQNGLI